MKNNIIVGLTLLFIIALGAFYINLRKQKPALSSKPRGGDFSISATTKSGKFNLEDQRGKIVLLYFGFTFCPDICPSTLSTFGTLLKNMPQKLQSQIVTLFISVDPERDTLEKLKDYVSFFYSPMIAATDHPDKVNKIASQYGVSYKKYYPTQGDSYYLVDHSTQAFIIDRSGKVTDFIHHGENAQQIKEKLEKYLKD